MTTLNRFLLILLAISLVGLSTASVSMAQTPSTFPRPGSCQPYLENGETVNVCGTRWQAGGIASDFFDLDGCSCKADCGYQGDCCPDAADYCQSQEVFGDTAPLPDSGGFDSLHMDGDQWVNLIEPVGVASVNGTGLGNTLGGFKYRGIAPAENRIAGLTRVGFNSFETRDSSVGCWIRSEPDVDQNDHIYVGAMGACGDWDHDDNGDTFNSRGCIKKNLFSSCAAGGLAQPPANRGGVLLQSASQQLYTGCENGGTSGCGALYKTATLGPIVDANGNQSFPLLERVMMTEYERLFSNRHPSNQCRVYEYQGNWKLVSFSDQTIGDAICKASIVTSTGEDILPTACPAFEEVRNTMGGGSGSTSCTDDGLSTPLFRATAVGGGFNLGLRESHYNEIAMFSDTTHTCFLQQYKIDGDFDTTSNGDDKATCDVYERNSKWWLKAQTEGDASLTCEARCMQIPKPNYDPTRPIAESGLGYPQTWPPRPAHVATSAQTRAGANLVGPRMELFQSGNYDKPMVIVEGFDAGNSQSVGDNFRRVSPLVRLALRYGIDVWVVEPSDGALALDQLARQNAMAFRYAYRHQSFNAQNPLYRIAVVGFSGGGLTSRLAMAYWDQQRFKTPTDPLYLSPDYGYGPPVSHFVTVGSPHEGANVPLSLQLFVQDLGGDFDIGNVYQALNSDAAKDMLAARIEEDCNNVVTETCYDNRVPIDDGTVECNDGLTCGNGPNRCAIDFSSYKQTSGDWPTTPHFAAVSNGSWAPQSCERLPDSEIARCDDELGPGEFTTNSELGFLRFVLDDGYFFTACDRESRIDAKLSQWDQRPGDVLGGALSGITFGAIPRQIKDLIIEQFIPYTFIHTESALACPTGTDDASCRAFNRANGRADHVVSNPGRFNGVAENGFHDSLDFRRAHELIAFIVDAWDTDQDGWCDPAANPVLVDYNSKMTPLGLPPIQGCLDPLGDCNDDAEKAYPGAPEICDDIDNDCNGGIDEGFEGKGLACNNGLLGACYRAGTTGCNYAGDDVVCVTETVQPTEEVCGNAIDDDCDGLINEGCPPDGGGGCKKGTCINNPVP